MLTLLDRWDTQLFFSINGSTSSWLDMIMPLFSDPEVLWTAAGLILSCWALRCLYFRDKTQLRRVFLGSILLALCVGATDVAAGLAKRQAGRVRPQHALPLARFMSDGQWRQRPADFIPYTRPRSSFFSGHAANTMALATGVSTLYPPAAPLIYLMPIVVGYSRVYLAKHYPGDVVAGWLAGWCITTLICRLAKRRGPFKDIMNKKD